jgi:hypothetical protein
VQIAAIAAWFGPLIFPLCLMCIAGSRAVAD